MDNICSSFSPNLERIKLVTINRRDLLMLNLQASRFLQYMKIIFMKGVLSLFVFCLTSLRMLDD